MATTTAKPTMTITTSTITNPHKGETQCPTTLISSCAAWRAKRFLSKKSAGLGFSEAVFKACRRLGLRQDSQLPSLLGSWLAKQKSQRQARLQHALPQVAQKAAELKPLKGTLRDAVFYALKELGLPTLKGKALTRYTQQVSGHLTQMRHKQEAHTNKQLEFKF